MVHVHRIHDDGSGAFGPRRLPFWHVGWGEGAKGGNRPARPNVALPAAIGSLCLVRTPAALLMLAVGLAVRDAIVETSGLAPDLRWPNDVLLNGKKCAGILAQMEGGAIVVGIGINVNHSSFPPRLAGIATSLRLEGARVTRENILVALARSLDEWAELVASSPGKILARFGEVSSYAYNRRVRVEQEGTALEGVTCGLDSMGFLRLRQDSGVEATILAGGVRPV